jgi:SPP1 gp7 family putative phage head morphogenesis protein
MYIYQSADDAIKQMNRRNIKAFGGLRLMKHDELNIIRKVSEVYDGSAKYARARYYEIAYEAYIIALVQCHWTNLDATRRAEEDIDYDWVDEMLEDEDFVTLYRFDTETDRKKQRLIEALAVSQRWNDEIDKALKLWTKQVGQYAINATDNARMAAFSKAGIKKVKWNTAHDEKVCEECDGRDGKIYPIDKAPGKAHYGCRCWYSPVLED